MWTALNGIEARRQRVTKVLNHGIPGVVVEFVGVEVHPDARQIFEGERRNVRASLVSGDQRKAR